MDFFIKISTTDQSQALDNLIASSCILQTPAKKGEIKHNITSKSASWEIITSEDGLYNLFFINCAQKPVTFKMKLVEYNIINGEKCYLPAGDVWLPLLFGVATLVYTVMAIVWIVGPIKEKWTLVNKVHYLMTALLFFKIFSLFSKSIEYHFLKIHGTPQGWNIPYYVFGFCKGIMLFVVVGLIGMGYSFFRYYLVDRDRKILMVVLPLQILANVAQIESLEGSWGSIEWRTWTTIFQVVDIACCVAVVVPIALSIKHLKEAGSTDGKAAMTMQKLQLFRQFYLIVLAYLYFTRIVVIFTKLAVPFTIEWINDLFEEVATVAFYCVIGYKFRPKEDSPYFQLEDRKSNSEVEMVDMKHNFLNKKYKYRLYGTPTGVFMLMVTC